MMRIFSTHFFTFFLVVLALTGCATTNLTARADAKALPLGFQRERLQTDQFLLTIYKKMTAPTKPVHVYIEGDGNAWLSRDEISPNPTPRKALALSLATVDATENILYIARPCQFTPLDLDPRCDEKYWTSHRFSEEAVTSVNQAITALLGTHGSTPEIHLIGYSGGGAIAVLVAARRSDIASIRTVAGNLDHAEVNRLQRVTSLSGSLNAINQAPNIRKIPQWHFSGEVDPVVPPAIAQRFKTAAGEPHCIQIQTIPSLDHEAGWVEHWPELLRQPIGC